MPSAKAVYNGSAPRKPDHKYTHHGATSGGQNLGNDRLANFLERGASEPQDTAARHAQILACISSVDAKFNHN
ncbi:hypothetical protein MHUMG1_06593 [Metarhizium humberi]|uniref:Uncharacterized protein n=1 Tax=Metarhizium humberi TaxID=2596975 RepID=A0A9P8M7V4_9HYPO|nr:hypothetical protein MHUMG1_06593 [Metarhizium humberi]